MDDAVRRLDVGSDDIRLVNHDGPVHDVDRDLLTCGRLGFGAVHHAGSSNLTWNDVMKEHLLERFLISEQSLQLGLGDRCERFIRGSKNRERAVTPEGCHQISRRRSSEEGFESTC